MPAESRPGESGNESRPGCLFALLQLLRGGRKGEADYPYRLREDFITRGEAAFYEVLLRSVSEEYVIFAKVRLCDVLKVAGAGPGSQAAFNRIKSKHVDFLICNRKTLRPCLAIELDDKTHKQEDRKARDAFMDKAFAAAGLPLLHEAASSRYESAGLRERINTALRPRTNA